MFGSLRPAQTAALRGGQGVGSVEMSNRQIVHLFGAGMLTLDVLMF